MNLVPIPQCSFNVSSSTIRRCCSQRSITCSFRTTATAARDRVIDFGKYKGKMLGTLPSKYLKWVTKNLRARDFEEWAHLADQVLSDPIYKDRIEWEFAQNLLNGNDVSTKHKNAVSELLEISTRFGWDNEDKLAWSKIDFEMLGTSKGGRIPRKTIGIQDKKAATGVDTNTRHEEGEKLDNRETRRQRVRLQRRKNEESPLQHSTITQTRPNSAPTTRSGMMETTTSPFPGRESLLKKALSLGTSKK